MLLYFNYIVVNKRVLSTTMQAQLVNQVVGLWDRYYLAAHGFPIRHGVDPMLGSRTLSEANERLGRGIIFGHRSFKSDAVNEFVAHVSSMGGNLIPSLQRLVDHMYRIIVTVHRAYNQHLQNRRVDNCPYHCSENCFALGSEEETTECHRYFDWNEVTDDELVESFNLTTLTPIGTAIPYRRS